MGQDLPAVATRMDRHPESIYHLWLKEQVIVLLSRTHFAENIFFCGNTPEETADSLLQVLYQNTQFTGYMLDLLQKLQNFEKAWQEQREYKKEDFIVLSLHVK